ncbi:MAG: UDP-glucose 4-epimerase GalE [Gemmatimonadetes bacterium]|nr:UDP-glucose 4-epimerase GalE [Gemmatimonadota bacterium]
MKVLVTGGAGYIGSVVAERLVEEGHETAVLDDFSKGHRDAVPPECDVVEVDLRDRAALRKALHGRTVDVVMHMAAASLVGESMKDPGKYFEYNCSAGVNLLEEAMAAGADKFVLSSTAATYGEPEGSPITEEFPNVPTNPYGESKLLFERMLAWYSKVRGLSWTSLRYFNAAGASRVRGEHHDPETHLIPLVLLAAARGTEVKVFGDDYPTRDGTCIRDYIHILDLADAHLAAMDALTRGVSGIFNLGNGEGFSVKEVIAAAEAVTGKPIKTVVTERRAGDPPSLIASSARARESLGWRPSREDLQEIIASAWAWHQDHPEGYAK